MKTLQFACMFYVAIMFLSCASTVNTTRSSYRYPPTPMQEPIEVFGLNDYVPTNTVNLGTIRIGDSGFSVGCGYEAVIQKIINACRKIGGNAIQLVSVKEPDWSSTCYRMTAYALRIEKQLINKSIEKTGYTEAKLKEEWNNKGTDAIEGIYEKFGDGQSAKYTLAIRKKNNSEYDAIYLSGALTQYRNNWLEGDLKAKIMKTATPNFYRVEWYMADKSKNTNMYITFDRGFMKTFWSENNMEEIYIKIYPTAVITGTGNSSSEWIGNGSGFFIDYRGYIATNYHVVEDANQIEVNFIRDGRPQTFKAEVIQSDRQNDLAILKITDNSLRPFASIPYNFQTTLSDVGTNIFALGYPIASVMGSEIKFTDGKISSRTGMQGDIRMYQISVPLQPGNSGGALFDYDGNLIGVTSARLNRDYFDSENVNYAIKSSYLKNLVEVLPISIRLPNDRTIATKTLTEKIKILSDYIVLIKVR